MALHWSRIIFFPSFLAIHLRIIPLFMARILSLKGALRLSSYVPGRLSPPSPAVMKVPLSEKFVLVRVEDHHSFRLGTDGRRGGNRGGTLAS